MPDQVTAPLPDAAAHAYLSGAFAPVTDELDAANLPVRGSLPAHLEGTYLRNGPNPRFVPLGSYVYPFDGDGMIHAVSFEGGRVSYRNRWVLTKGLAAERQAGRALYGGMLTPVSPDPARLDVGGDPGPFKNVANANVISHLGRLLALWDGGTPYELSRGLATIGEYDFRGALPGAMTAHPKLDPVWDELVFFRYDFAPPYLVFGVVGPKGKITRTEPIDIPDPVLMHDFAVTDRHVVFFDSPAIFDLSALMRAEPVLHWDESRGTRVGVMPRDGSGDDVVWIPTENFFAMHVMNAYTLGNSVIVDYVYRRRLGLGAAASDNGPRLHRAVIDLQNRSWRDELFDDRTVELPRIDPRRVGLRYRFGYAAALTKAVSATRDAAFDAIVRHDFEHDRVSEYRLPEGITVGEPQFVADTDGRGEDAGWVLAFTYDTTRDASALAILPADDFGAPPVAVVPLPRRVPEGSHGTWVPRQV